MRVRSWAQIVVAVIVLRGATLVLPVFNQDEAYIAIQAQVENAGGELYRDVVDRKPPLVPHIYAAVFRAVGSDSLIAVHVLAIVWVAATALAIGAIARRRAGPAAERWASWLFVLSSMALLPRDALAANYEIWMLLPICLAMLVGGRGNPAADFVAGALVGVATFMKQPALVTLAPLAVAIVRAPHRVAGCALMLAGFGTAVQIVIATHDVGMLQWGFFGTGGYLRPDDLGFAARMFAIWTGTFVVATAALGWLVVRAARTRGLRADLELWVWLATAFVGVAAGLRFLGHYHLQLLLAACVLAAPPAALLAARAQRRVIAGLAVPALICAGLAYVMPNQPFDADYRGVARYLRAHTASHERILVWGHFPEIYWAAGRLPAMRFVHSGFMTGQSGARRVRPHDTQGATAGAWEAMFEDLARTPPMYVVELSHGAIRKAQHFPIERYPRLAAWFARHYRFETIVDGIWLYRRRD